MRHRILKCVKICDVLGANGRQNYYGGSTLGVWVLVRDRIITAVAPSSATFCVPMEGLVTTAVALWRASVRVLMEGQSIQRQEWTKRERGRSQMRRTKEERGGRRRKERKIRKEGEGCEKAKGSKRKSALLGHGGNKNANSKQS